MATGLTALLIASLAAAAPPASSAPPATPPGQAAAPSEESGEAGLDTPRGLIARFLDDTRDGRYGDAARLLALRPGQDAAGPAIARELKAVLDRHLWVDLQEVSAVAEGRLDDGLGPDSEELGRVPGPEGKLEPVRLTRVGPEGRREWRFSRSTVERVPAWYQALPGRWALEHIPASLQRPGPLELLRWQWLALLPLLLVSWSLGALLGRISRALVLRLARRTRTGWDDAVAARMGGPLSLAWGLAVAGLLVRVLELAPPAQTLADRVLRGGFLLFLFWALFRAIDVAVGAIGQAPWARERPGSRSLVSIGGRIGKVLAAALALVAALSELGYPVASLVAGLGLGGLAFALAAQKTVENLFGALSIGVDQPFREGDFVRVEEMVGTVEAIGLRSTRIRTLDRTLVSIPNGRLADMRLESFTARDRIRLACDIGLVYETTGDQMRAVLTGVERVLREHPLIWPDAVVVRFKQFGAFSLDIEVMAWFQTQDWGRFQEIRQEILLRFMDVVRQAGTSMAFPTQTLHLAEEPASDARTQPRERRNGERVAETGRDVRHGWTRT